MKRITCILTFAILSALAIAPVARADFGVKGFDVTFENEDGSPATQAGSHPFAATTGFQLNTVVDPKFGVVPDGQLKTLIAKQPDGFTGSPLATPKCDSADFLTLGEDGYPSCPDSTVVGITSGEVTEFGKKAFAPVYNLVPPPGVVAKVGFFLVQVPVTVEIGLGQEPPYNVTGGLINVSQAVEVYGGQLQLWGVPADPAHDPYRGRCLDLANAANQIESNGICKTNAPEVPFITLPRSCTGPMTSSYEAISWQNPFAVPVSGSVLSHDNAEPPNPQGMTGCSKLGFSPTIAARPTSLAAQSPTGLDFSLDVHDEGLTNPAGLAQSDIKRAVVTLPEGFTTNPSQAEGLEVCSEADLDRETLNSEPGAGCPNASKIGTVEVESPLVDEALKGSLFIAEPYENRFGSLLAVYLVFKNPTLGIIVKQALKVESDPLTGRITTVADDIPQLPFSHFRLHFREGTRSPLATPPTCDGDPSTPGRDPFTVAAELTPWAGGAPLTTTSSFEITSGPNGAPCPAGGTPPFRPELEAGTLNNAAGRFSPFVLRLSRNDGEQEFTNFSIKLPPGVAAKLAGIPFCSDAAIAAATARTGPHGGQEELDSPSCPAASQVGRTLAGAGVGPSLAYAPGKIYLAGPYHGAPLSMVSVTSGVVGPFDIGTVVVRLAVDVNPETGEVFLDSTGSDPIPHIVKGIPIHLRDIRAYTDRPEFTFNPTSCEPTSTAATVLGSGLDFASALDDNPFVSTSRFQAADCAALPFGPKLGFKLQGGTKRGANPSLRAHVGMNGFGEAAIRYAQVTLPKSEFLEQGHIGTICTRVQFKEGAVPGERCPAASVYGKVIARTPILDEPLAGPIFLRSSEHKLPDLVAALHGSEIDVSLVGRIDSGKNGGIRNTFEFVPDAPVTSADFTFFGGKKSLLSNSRNLCRSTNKVKVFLKAHSGKRVSYKTPLKPMGCKKKGHARSKRHARHR
ncbi:MAG: hypothetical protein QOF06_1151 [Solirubrobacterales bacterium]|jgi:hypothetical protein|nr:hypothetical protein [Solirubrobacterales bacterium]